MRPRRNAALAASAAPRAPTAAGRDEARRAVDDQFSAAYEELRRLASAVRRGRTGETLTPTALVAEAWMKLAASPCFAQTSPLHFRRVAARAMRQVMVEAARRRRAAKRGGPQLERVDLDRAGDASSWAEDIVALDDALHALEALEERQARVVEARFFGGLGVAETAELLGVSEAAVERDWRAARAWLSRELGARR